MKYCVECGGRLEERFLEHEGMIPYCPHCEQYRFPIFSSAVSVVIVNPTMTKTLFIQQYGKNKNILVAGYINKGESAEDAVCREMMEEIGVKPSKLVFQKSSYWSKSNAIIFNFYAIIEEEIIYPNHEIDSYQWFDVTEALDVVSKGGLAEVFYQYFYKNNLKSKNVL